MSETLIKVSIQRYRPELDNKPFMQDFEIPFEDDMSVIDALQYIKDHHDGSLSFRWSCRMAICGSCGYMVNGVPKLGCKTFLRDYLTKGIKVESLANFPIERDLVADIGDFIEKLEQVKPYIIRKDEKAISEGEHLQTPAELTRYRQYSLCINCGLCYAACPQYGLNNEFMGPAALTLLHRYNQDNRDQGRDERIDIVNAEEGVWGCTFVGYCSEVCPKGVDPAAAIQQGKVESSKDFVLSKLRPRKSS